MKKLINSVALLLMLWACLPSLVSAHAYIAQSTPYQDAELPVAPPAIRITFTEKIDLKLSSISLKRVDKAAAITGVLSDEGDLKLIYTIPKLENGIYEVSWQVLSQDSHMTDGTFQFAVGVKLGHAKPDETISLDGNAAGGSEVVGSKGEGAEGPEGPEVTKETGTGAVATNKPAVSAKPAPTNAPIATNGSASTTRPAASPARTDEPSPSHTPSTQEAEKPSLELPDENVSPYSPPETDEATDLADHSSHNHNEHSGGSHETDSEHEHSGGNGGMIALRVLDIFASAAAAGLLFFRYVIWREDEKDAPIGFSLRAERMVIGAAALTWLLTGLTRLGMLSNQLGGVSFYALASGTMIGKVAAVRPILALLLLLLAFAPIQERAWANRIKFAAVTALIVTFPLTGHAYGALKDAALAIAAHAVHMSAAAVWFGGLAGLFSLTLYRGASKHLNQAARRFSLWALPSMALILVSGIWLSAARLTDVEQLISSAYGRLILAKAFFMLLILVIAALHKLIFMPRLAQTSSARGLLIGVRIEVLLAVALFVLAGMLSSTSPPVAQSAYQLSEPIYWHVMGEKAHMSLRISDNKQTKQQSVRLDVWLPEGQGAPASAIAGLSRSDEESVTAEDRISRQETFPLELQPQAAERFEFPGFTKYTYLASGQFVDDRKREGLLMVDVKDGDGNSFHYEQEIRALLLY